MALPLFSVSKLATSALNAMINVINKIGSTAVIPTSTTSGVTISATGKVTIPAGTASPVLIDGLTGYENFDVVWKLVTSASVAIVVNLRNTTPATDTTSSYDYQQVTGLNSTVAASPSTSGALWNTGVAATKHSLRGTLIGLTLAEPTEFLFQNHDYNQASGFTSQVTLQGAGHHANTIMGGLALSWASGTVAGEVWVKGLSD